MLIIIISRADLTWIKFCPISIPRNDFKIISAGGMAQRHALLISNSTLHGSGYLEHCRDAIIKFLGEKPRRVLFFPFALADHEAYANKARTAFESFGHTLTSAHEAEDKKQAVQNAEVRIKFS